MRNLGAAVGAFAFPVLLVALPLAGFLVMSFWRMEGAAIVHDWTVANYVEWWTNEIYPQVFGGTVLLAAEVMAVGLLIGYPVAWFIWRRRGALRWVLLLAVLLPLFSSYIVKLYAIRSLLGPAGFVNAILIWSGLLERPSTALLFNQRAVLVTMAMIYLPFAVLPIFLALERIPPRLLRASADLGATPGQTFRHVVLPLSLPGAIVGGLFAFVLALGDFVTPQMVGGPTGFTYGRVVQSQFGMAYNWPFGAALAVVLLAASLAVIVLAARIQKASRV